MARGTLEEISGCGEHAKTSLLAAYSALKSELPAEARKSGLLTAVFVTAYCAAPVWKNAFGSFDAAKDALAAWLRKVIPAASQGRSPIAAAIWVAYSDKGWATYPVGAEGVKKPTEKGRKVAPVQLLVLSKLK
jgi:hypothetical protein